MKKRKTAALIAAFVLLISFGAATEEETEKIFLGDLEIEVEEETINEFENSQDGSPTVPEWADVILNARGFLDDGEYVLEDEEEGHYMYVSPTIRVQIERTYEVPNREHPFYCFTAHIWCDTEGGELPFVADSDPENPGHAPKCIRDIAVENNAVFATSTDYYTYRSGAKAQDYKFYHVGIIIRHGNILWDDPMTREMDMPNYETFAILDNGDAESYMSTDYSADQYLADGATEVFTFGPCLVRDGELTEYIKRANKSYNPRLALGVAEAGHYVAVLCEGRVARSKGVQMAHLAQIMKDNGCRIAVNMDGGQTAVFAFMGKQLNQVIEELPRGRAQVEALVFGTSELAGLGAENGK